MRDAAGGTARAVVTVADIAGWVDGRVVGNGSTVVERMAPLDEADGSAMGFLALHRYARLVPGSRAGSFLVSSEMEARLPPDATRVVVADPYPALRAVLERLSPARPMRAEVHPTAVLGTGVRLGEGVRIGPYAVLEDGVEVGTGTSVGAHCVVGRGTVIGAGCTLHPHVVTYAGSVLGAEVTLHAGVRIGSDGFGYTQEDGVHHKVPHVGRAVIEDGVEIGANTTVDRGSIGDTVVGRGSKIDNLVQVAHNVTIGAGSMLAALVGIAGSTRIGRGAWLGGRASAINHLTIGDGAKVAFGSTVMRDVKDGETVSGYPARPHHEQLRAQAQVNRLPKLVERVERLEGSR